MGRDIVASAKEFEQQAKTGTIPEVLARELDNMNDADRLAVAKQIDWDMAHQSNHTLPKIEFYDSGDLKSLETSGKSGSTEWKDHVELDKDNGRIIREVKTDDTNLSSEHDLRVEITGRDASGNIHSTISQQRTYVERN